MPDAMTREEIEASAMEGRQVAGHLDNETTLRLLHVGEISVIGRLLSASNGTFFCLVDGHAADGSTPLTATCVYKPVRGERPLADFPDGSLACRERGAYGVSVASGWDIVPPTVLRDGPLGPGMVQLWVEVDPEVDIVELARLDLPALRRIALLDAVLDRASVAGAHRVWLVTTNDNVDALRFYQRRGMRLVRLWPDAVTQARKLLKPEIPLIGAEGIPIRDELELEIRMSAPAPKPGVNKAPAPTTLVDNKTCTTAECHPEVKDYRAVHSSVFRAGAFVMLFYAFFNIDRDAGV